MNAHGGVPSEKDIRNYRLSKNAVSRPNAFPEKFILTNLPDVKNQWNIGSCTAHATSSILEYYDKNKHNLSTNFIYGMRKRISGRVKPGMSLLDACKIVTKYGDMTTFDCPGNDETPICNMRADKALSNSNKAKSALRFKINGYYDCKTNEDIKYSIYHHGPVLANLKWYDNYKASSSGTIIGSKSGHYNYHTVMIYGYTKTGFWCQNSWGKEWGKAGRFFITTNQIDIKEAKCLIDYINKDEVIVPKKSSVLNKIYKSINLCINTFERKGKDV